VDAEVGVATALADAKLPPLALEMAELLRLRPTGRNEVDNVKHRVAVKLREPQSSGATMLLPTQQAARQRD
jgi:hypothetical protein